MGERNNDALKWSGGAVGTNGEDRETGELCALRWLLILRRPNALIEQRGNGQAHFSVEESGLQDQCSL